jgi:hypothetical protein
MNLPTWCPNLFSFIRPKYKTLQRTSYITAQIINLKWRAYVSMLSLFIQLTQPYQEISWLTT